MTLPLPLGLIALLVLGHTAFAGNRFTFTLQAVALGATPLAIGTVMGLLMVVPMFLAVRIGRWSDRLGYGRPAAAGLAMLVASGLVVAAFPSMPALYVASVLTGTGYMLAHVAVNNAIGRAVAPQHMTQAFSVMAMGFSLSGLAGPLIAGFAIDGAGHRVAFLVATAFAVSSCMLLRTALRKHPDPGSPASGSGPTRVLDLLKHKPLRAVFVVSGLISMGWDLFTFLAPLQGVRSGLSATQTGLLMAAFGAGTFAIRLFLPWLSRRAGQWATLSGVLFVTALGYVAFPFLDRFVLLLPAAFMLGLSLGCGQPMGMSLLHMNAPAHRAGEAVGVRSTITSASQTVLPMLFGALGSALGVLAVFWAAAALLAAGGVFALKHGAHHQR